MSVGPLFPVDRTGRLVGIEVLAVRFVRRIRIVLEKPYCWHRFQLSSDQFGATEFLPVAVELKEHEVAVAGGL